MSTTTAHLRSPTRRPARLWARTIRLGVVTSAAAAMVAVVVRVLTPIPVAAIVILAALVAFTLSWHVANPTVRRERRIVAGSGQRPRPDRPPLNAA